MRRGSENRFRFSLGRAGFVIFVSGIAALLLLSFLFGIIVGRNMDTYPRKIAQEIPAAITKKIAGVIQGEKEEPPPKGPEGKTEEPSFKYRFFETLTEKKEPPAGETKTREAPGTGKEGKAAPPAERYGIQVASFRDRNRALEVQKTLQSLGLSPVMDPVDLNNRGTWYRIRLGGFSSYEKARATASAVEKELRGTRCVIRKE